MSYVNILSQTKSARKLQHVVGRDEFDPNYCKTSNLTLMRNFIPPGKSQRINIILDPQCLDKYNKQNGLCGVQLRYAGPYQVCQHVVYCPFTCPHNHYFKKVLGTSDDRGTSLSGLICPFNDCGKAKPQSAIYVGSYSDVTLLYQTSV